MKTRLSSYLVVAFRYLREHELQHLPLGSKPSDEAEEVGVCDGMEARKLFFETVNMVIIPGLEALGFAATDAWNRSYGDIP